MSGIVGSAHNIRGSGVVAKLGTDGQVFTSAGAGVSQTFEAAAGGGTILSVAYKQNTAHWTQTCVEAGTPITDGSVDFNIVVTPESTSSKFMIGSSWSNISVGRLANRGGYLLLERAISGGATTDLVGDDYGTTFSGTFDIACGSTRNYQAGQSMQIFDAPNTASAITYTFQCGAHDASETCDFGFNPAFPDDTAAGYNNVGICAMWVIEY